MYSHTFSGLKGDEINELIETFGKRCRKWDKAQGFATVEFESEEEFHDWDRDWWPGNEEE
jgi:hypothetical protein